MDELFYGYVDWFGSKGLPYGYIKRDTDSLRTYVHYKGISVVGQVNPKYKTLLAGQRVKYRIIQGYHNPGTQAVDVEIVGEYASSGYQGDGDGASPTVFGSYTDMGGL